MNLHSRFDAISGSLLQYKRADRAGEFFLRTIRPMIPKWKRANERDPKGFSENTLRLSRAHKSALRASLGKSAEVPGTLEGVFEHLDELIVLAMKAGARDAFLEARPASLKRYEPPDGILELDLHSALHTAIKDQADLEPERFRQSAINLRNEFYQAANRAVFAQQFEIETFEPHDSKIARYARSLRDAAVLAYALSARLTLSPQIDRLPQHEKAEARLLHSPALQKL